MTEDDYSDLGGQNISSTPSGVTSNSILSISKTGFIRGILWRNDISNGVDLSSILPLDDNTQQTRQTNGAKSREQIFTQLAAVLEEEEEEFRGVLSQNKKIFSNSNNHTLVTCQRCRPDIMLATRNNPDIPVLLIEVLSSE
eukprot:Rmarinus@m.13194